MTFAADITADATSFAEIPFRVRVTDGWNDWASVADVVTRRIPGSNAAVTQFMGLGPEHVSYELILASTSDFTALKTLVGTQATLILRDDAATTDGEGAMVAGVPVLVIADVLLVGIDPESVRREGDLVFCQADFQRDASP